MLVDGCVLDSTDGSIAIRSVIQPKYFYERILTTYQTIAANNGLPINHIHLCFPKYNIVVKYLYVSRSHQNGGTSEFLF